MGDIAGLRVTSSRVAFFVRASSRGGSRHPSSPASSSCVPWVRVYSVTRGFAGQSGFKTASGSSNVVNTDRRAEMLRTFSVLVFPHTI